MTHDLVKSVRWMSKHRKKKCKAFGMLKGKIYSHEEAWSDRPVKHYKTTSELVRTVLAVITLVVQIIILIHVV